MAGLRAFSSSFAAWGSYAYGLAALSALLVPRAGRGRWGRRWMRARIDERLVLARAVGATSQVS
jgi:hypothetical protein